MIVQELGEVEKRVHMCVLRGQRETKKEKRVRVEIMIQTIKLFDLRIPLLKIINDPLYL